MAQRKSAARGRIIIIPRRDCQIIFDLFGAMYAIIG